METKIKEIIAKIACVDITFVTQVADIRSDLGMDSLDIYEAYLMVNEEYDIEISDDDAFAINTVSDVINCAQKYIDEK